MVGLSLLTLIPGVVGGSETYARELIKSLARVGKLEYRVFLPEIAPDAADGLPSKVVHAYPASRSLPGRLAAMTRAAVAPGAIRAELELDRLHAIHFPVTVMLPRVERPPAVATILDIAHEMTPDHYARSERAYRKVVYGWTVRRSRLLIAISEHVADTLVDRLGVPRERIRVIYLGLDHSRLHPGAGEREPFLLYPANRWPHKNHTRLFEAFELVRRERPELRLVLTGYGHDGRPLPECVEARGRVPDDELAGLYRRASALVFPSLYEGFGQPPLEAMACGCPVASSTAGSLPEVCGDAARYFDATQPSEIAAAVLELLADPEPYVAHGLERAKLFDWDECARRHEAVYEELSA
jgi:glycosyltransferase involved in cell wall biosynthesis